jgi:hypothetical protein
MKSLTDTGLKPKRYYAGSGYGDLLTKWLNDNTGTTAYSKVVGLLQDLKALTGMLSERDFDMLCLPRRIERNFLAHFQLSGEQQQGFILAAAVSYLHGRGEEPKLDPKIKAYVEQFNEFAKGVRASPPKMPAGYLREDRSDMAALIGKVNSQLISCLRYPQLSMVSSRPNSSSDIMGFDWSTRQGDPDAVSYVLDLAPKGYVQRVRQCSECEKWFYARVKDQRFCSQRCQQKFHTTSEKGKARRREYMREYMRTYKPLQKSGKVK